MYTFEVSFPGRYYETDQMGVVHHSNYIRYFECARNSMMDSWDYPIQQCEADGVTIPIVEVQCKYRFPARMGDTLTVKASIGKVPAAKLVIIQSVCNQHGQVCAEGQVVLGFLNKATGRPVRCPEKLLSIIGRLIEDSEQQ